MDDDELQRLEIKCRRLLNALTKCRKIYPREPERSMLCSRLSTAAATCLVASICPKEIEAIETHCGSVGTEKKRRRCVRAKEDLQTCLERHQDPWHVNMTRPAVFIVIRESDIHRAVVPHLLHLFPSVFHFVTLLYAMLSPRREDMPSREKHACLPSPRHNHKSAEMVWFLVVGTGQRL